MPFPAGSALGLRRCRLIHYSLPPGPIPPPRFPVPGSLRAVPSKKPAKAFAIPGYILWLSHGKDFASYRMRMVAARLYPARAAGLRLDLAVADGLAAFPRRPER